MESGEKSQSSMDGSENWKGQHKLEDGDREKETVEEGMGRTIPNIRILNLLQDFRPDRCVALFIFVDAFGAQVEPLADAAGTLVG